MRLAGWVATGWATARLAGLAAPRLREHTPERVKMAFPGGYKQPINKTPSNQTARLQDYKLPNCKTRGIQGLH